MRQQPGRGAAAQISSPAGVKKAAGGRAGEWADAGGRARGRGRAQQAAAQPCGEGVVVVVVVDP
jgi:hypothetical protein